MIDCREYGPQELSNMIIHSDESNYQNFIRLAEKQHNEESFLTECKAYIDEITTLYNWDQWEDCKEDLLYIYEEYRPVDIDLVLTSALNGNWSQAKLQFDRLAENEGERSAVADLYQYGEQYLGKHGLRRKLKIIWDR